MYHDRYADLRPGGPVEGDVRPYPRRAALTGEPVARLPRQVTEQDVGLEALFERLPLEERVLEGVAQRTDGIGEDVIEHVRRQTIRPLHSSPMDTLTGELEYPMVIVTTVADGERSGCLVGFHSQCSIDPPRWAVWISKKNHTYRIAINATTLAVHFPSIDDRDLAELFGEATGDDVDKFERCAWTAGPDGVPLLDRIPNRLVGMVVDTLDDDCDHQCFVVDMADVQHARPVRQLGFQAVRGFEAGHPA